jgi:hypothetical protein
MNEVKQVEGKIRHLVCSSKGCVFLRDDFTNFGTSPRVSQAIANLQKASLLEKIGYGVYIRASDAPIHVIIHEAKARLNGFAKRHLVISGRIVSLK